MDTMRFDFLVIGAGMADSSAAAALAALTFAPTSRFGSVYGMTPGSPLIRALAPIRSRPA